MKICVHRLKREGMFDKKSEDNYNFIIQINSSLTEL